ncbi:PbsX family transcriptional regulator [Salinisphaera sp. P385]|uniref:PbsX family transcriptional regulator n=1 Tax=Spectribacter acetivorans TaxID=3075603 RepID=A0ABU3B625_9GAMM|nr:AbrB/MazE/SpoVT family DNA-binding domain-containing protein [Salinisphaera sp. P385]MDT0617580.1 PbsX family transcriptional regulator [Salinisphaera sp. P385]
MEQCIKKWGNGAAVRLPVAIMKQAHLCIDAQVELRVENGRIVIEPARPTVYSLADLIAGITEENRHDAMDTGEPVGDEAL